MAGLMRFYRMDGERAVSFFKVNQTLHEEHSEAENETVVSLCAHRCRAKGAALEAVEATTESLWRFLEGVYGAWQIALQFCGQNGPKAGQGVARAVEVDKTYVGGHGATSGRSCLGFWHAPILSRRARITAA